MGEGGIEETVFDASNIEVNYCFGIHKPVIQSQFKEECGLGMYLACRWMHGVTHLELSCGKITRRPYFQPFDLNQILLSSYNIFSSHKFNVWSISSLKSHE